jgi:TRAP transporter TAXI family solute receptor
MSRIRATLGGFAAAIALAAAPAAAETRVVYKSAKSASSYYQMAVQLAEAVKAGSAGEIVLTVEESQGSVQNVKEAARRSGNYVFTTPPVLVKLAKDGKAMFEAEGGEPYGDVRALFPIPYLTMHMVVRADTGAETLEDLAGLTFLVGKGSFGAREAQKYLDMFGLAEDVEIANVELGSSVAALKDRQIDGFATAGSYPAPNVMEAAASVDVRVLSLTDAQIEETGRTRLVIPAGTYPGQDAPVQTTTLPVGAYTTTEMDEETAYRLTRTYWEEKADMTDEAAWWGGVDLAEIETLAGPLHPGALRYYEEVGAAIPESLR